MTGRSDALIGTGSPDENGNVQIWATEFPQENQEFGGAHIRQVGNIATGWLEWNSEFRRWEIK